MTKFIAGLGNLQDESALKFLDDMGISETRLRDALLRASNANDLFTNVKNPEYPLNTIKNIELRGKLSKEIYRNDENYFSVVLFRVIDNEETINPTGSLALHG